MQRLFNIDKWQLLEDGKAVNFGNDAPRRIRLDVNAPDAAKLFYADGDGRITFLARVHGRDRIEFACYGAFSLTADGGDIWFDTVDGEDFSFTIPDAVIITKIAERRARNHEFELMQYKMNQNLERRMQEQRDELERLWSRQQAAAAAAAPVAPAPSPSGAPAPEPAPAAPTDVNFEGVHVPAG